MNNEKRYPRSYKTTTRVYERAMKRARKNKVALANIVENVIEAYSEGWDIKAVKIHPGQSCATALDIFSEDFSVNLTKAK